jgi:hypothetical protein
MNKFSIACIAVAVGLFGSLTVATGQNAGDLWQVTTQMSMVGLPIQMPTQTQQVCAERNWTRPPAGSGPDTSCRNTDFALSGNTATWKVTCQSPPSTGVGQIIRNGADAYSGSIKFASAQGEMTISLTGRKVGTCNP